MFSANQISTVRLMYNDINYPVVVCQEKSISLRTLFWFFQLQLVKIQMQKTELDQQNSHYVFFSLFVLMKYVAIQKNYLRVISGILSIPLKYSGESSGLQY